MDHTPASLFDALRPRYVTMREDPKANALLALLARSVPTLVEVAQRGRPPLEGLQPALKALGMTPGEGNLSQLLGAATRVLMADAGFEPEPDGRGGRRTLEIRVPNAVQKRAVVFRQRGAAKPAASPEPHGVTLAALSQQLQRMEAAMSEMQQMLNVLVAQASKGVA